MIIGTVPYINSLPLTRYLDCKIIKLTPAEIVKALLAGRIDVGLIPTYSILKHNLCMHPDAGIIGCHGPVKSVGFFTRPYITDLKEIRSLYMDVESRTAVHLAKVLLKKFYDVSLYDVEFVHYDNKHMADAQLLIGDKALFNENKQSLYWDLGRLWKKHTDTGFMFASWASKRILNDNEIYQLIKAKELGLANRESFAKEFEPKLRGKVLEYFNTNIIYEPLPKIKQGLKLYQEFLKEYQYIEGVKKVA